MRYMCYHYVPLNVITSGENVSNGHVSIYGVIITLQTNTTQSLAVIKCFFQIRTQNTQIYYSTPLMFTKIGTLLQYMYFFHKYPVNKL